ncbi:MAG TPA: DUF1326 domain-containing protein [Tepidisphaeraceae bacterium]|nr:DUF1326 domain-containing protein [Tepidisphaeraceae bacterium]
MRTRILASIALLACVAAVVYAAPSLKPSKSVIDAKIIGDYVEARTASVFAGACHYNGELVTVGKDAIMAWNFASGSVDGVDLAGVRVAAAVTSETNLLNNAPHRSELVVDTAATDRQVAAVVNLLRSRSGEQLGQIVTVRRSPVSFTHTSDGYSVDAKGFARMDVQYMPDDSCCKMPGNVWYSPLTPLQNRKVGYTETASYTGTIADRWQRSGENSAFYGSFSF